ncbi:hypothetical protein EJD97_000035 [Solanum chilense]|uniref:Uncharacterized protein n=1 Tax=Solanum chilense TaxID=4083 RepID=A0A6N2CKB6_SOLCI|nr:hypothetical protein EJD97_000035 [Solanum chilense]
MESIRKRRTGFMKGKLVKSLFRGRAVKASNYYEREESTTPIYHLHLHHHNLEPKEKLAPYNPNSIVIVNQEKAAPPQKTKVSYYIPTTSTGRDSNDNNIDTDESVDIKAANYISCVQERFRSMFK